MDFGTFTFGNTFFEPYENAISEAAESYMNRDVNNNLFTPGGDTRQYSYLFRKEATGFGLCSIEVGDIIDGGYEDDFRGWYDIEGCGRCTAYCR